MTSAQSSRRSDCCPQQWSASWIDDNVIPAVCQHFGALYHERDAECRRNGKEVRNLQAPLNVHNDKVLAKAVQASRTNTECTAKIDDTIDCNDCQLNCKPVPNWLMREWS